MGILRCLLALSVAIDYFGTVFGWRMGPGSVEVETFFIISGFYMYFVLHQKYYAAGIYKFYTARYMRLLPTCLAILVMSFWFGVLTDKSHRFGLPFSEQLSHLSGADAKFIAYIVFSNVTMFALDWTVLLGFDGTHAYWTTEFMKSPIPVYKFIWIPQAWSIGLELTFYLMAPFLLKTGKRIAVATAISIVSLLCIKFFGLPIDPFTHRFFPSILFLFLLGSVSCKVWINEYFQEQSRVKHLGLLALVVLTGFLIFWTKIPLSEPQKAILFPCLVAIFIGPIFVATRYSRIDSLLGEFSYPIYIAHLFALTIANTTHVGAKNELALLIMSAMALALVFLVERPTERWRAGIIKNTTKHGPAYPIS